jgi:hypothetical protein
MKNYKITLFGLVGAVSGFTIQGCFSPQPLPECTVSTDSYVVALEKLNQTGGTSCETLDHTDVFMTRFPAAAGGKSYDIALRPKRNVDIHNGDVFSAPTLDGTDNDCTKGVATPASCKTCVVAVDGGFTVKGVLVTSTALADGGVSNTVPAADGGTTKIDVKNFCGVPQTDAIPRVDPADPDAVNITSRGPVTLFPNNDGICVAATFSGGVQNTEEVALLDGTKLPAIKVQTEFTNLQVVNTSKALGSLWTANMKQVEGSCVTEYLATGWLPVVHCETLGGGDKGDEPITDTAGNIIPDEKACATVDDPDAGTKASGMNPNFEPICRIIGRDNAGLATVAVCAPNPKLTLKSFK